MGRLSPNPDRAPLGALPRKPHASHPLGGCEQLCFQMVFLQQRTEVQRQELQTGLDSQGTQQVELYQHKAKVL